MALQTRPNATATTPPTSILDYTLKTAPIQVVYGTGTFGALGALTGSAIAVTRNIPAIPAAFKTGINTSVFAFTFFSIREYILHPLLITLDLRPSPLTPPPSHILPNPHLYNLSSSALAGFFAGSVFSYFARGTTVGNLRSAGTLALGCTVVQGLMNEGDGMRIRAIVWAEERERRLKVIDADLVRDRQRGGESGEGKEEEERIPPTYTRSITSPVPSVPSRETFSERSDRLFSSAFRGLTDSLARISPVKKMDDGDYEKALRSRLSEVQKDRQKLKDEMDDIDSGNHAV